jgi:hypothetical protein
VRNLPSVGTRAYDPKRETERKRERERHKHMHNTTITLESEAPVSTVGPHPQAKPHVGAVYVEWGRAYKRLPAVVDLPASMKQHMYV